MRKEFIDELVKLHKSQKRCNLYFLIGFVLMICIMIFHKRIADFLIDFWI